MKKIISILFLFLTILFLFIGIEVYNLMYADMLLYNNVTEITVVQDSKLLAQSNTVDHLQYIQEHYGTYVAKYVFRNSDDMSIYTTDVTLNNKIKLKDGAFPKMDTNHFIGNILMKEPAQIGTFHYFSSTDSDVLIFPLNNLKTLADLTVFIS